MQIACKLFCLLERLHLVPFCSYFYPLVLPDNVIFCMVLCALMPSNTLRCRCCFLHLSILCAVCCVCTQSTKRKTVCFAVDLTWQKLNFVDQLMANSRHWLCIVWVELFTCSRAGRLRACLACFCWLIPLWRSLTRVCSSCFENGIS